MLLAVKCRKYCCCNYITLNASSTLVLPAPFSVKPKNAELLHSVYMTESVQIVQSNSANRVHVHIFLATISQPTKALNKLNSLICKHIQKAFNGLDLPLRPTHHRTFAVRRRRVQYQPDVLVRARVPIAAPLPQAIITRRIEQARIAQIQRLLHRILSIHQHIGYGGNDGVIINSAHIFTLHYIGHRAKSCGEVWTYGWLCFVGESHAGKVVGGDSRFVE